MHLPFTVKTTLATLGLTACVHAAGITLVNPSFYGLPNSTSQTWADYGSPAGPNAPTTTGLSAGTADYFDRTASTDGAFIIAGSNPARGRIYSFSGVVNPEIDVPLPALAAPGFATVILQAQVTGSPIDNSTFSIRDTAGSYGPKSVVITTQTSAGSQGPATEYDYVVTWNLLPASTNFSITYSPDATSSSQSTSRVDTYTQTPEPGALALAALGGLLLVRRRRSV